VKKQQIQRFSASTRGFSLTELLVVLAIVGVLAWLVILVNGRMRTFSQQTVCTSNLRTLHLASMDRPISKIPSDFTNPFWIPNR
jgi:prepilin-type N-terminal cleavage/methylation domain-containing protein